MLNLLQFSLFTVFWHFVRPQFICPTVIWVLCNVYHTNIPEVLALRFIFAYSKIFGTYGHLFIALVGIYCNIVQPLVLINLILRSVILYLRVQKIVRSNTGLSVLESHLLVLLSIIITLSIIVVVTMLMATTLLLVTGPFQ
jgi:hypothetical protein